MREVKRRGLYWLRRNVRPIRWHYDVKVLSDHTEYDVWRRFLPMRLGIRLLELAVWIWPNRDHTPLCPLANWLFAFGFCKKKRG